MKQSIMVFFTIILCVTAVGCGSNGAAKTGTTASLIQIRDVSKNTARNDDSVSVDQKSEIQKTVKATVGTTEKDAPVRTKESKNGFDDSTNSEIIFNGYSIAIPEYLGENTSTNANALRYYAELGLGVSMLTVETAKYDKSEDEYKKEEASIVMQVLTNLSKSMDVDLEKSDIKNRHYYASAESGGVTTDLEFEIRPLYLGDKIFVMIFVQSVNSDFDYFSDFAKIVNSVKPVEEKSSSGKTDHKEGNISPDFKKTMDEYEEFFDEYVDFMKKYQKNPSDLKLLGEMSDMILKESEMMNDFNNIDQKELTSEELSYYLEVQSRILKKLSEVY